MIIHITLYKTFIYFNTQYAKTWEILEDMKVVLCWHGTYGPLFSFSVEASGLY